MKRLFLYIKQNILRNALLSLGAVSVVMVISFFLLVLTSLGAVVYKNFHDIEKNVDYVIFLSKDVDASDRLVQDMKRDIELLPAQVSLVSKEQAIDGLKKSPALAGVVDDMVDFIKNYKGEVLPATLVVKNISAQDPQRISAILTQVKYKNIIDTASDQNLFTEQSERLRSLASLVTASKVVLVLLYMLFALVAFLVIFNTIRILIFSRREEIQIMELVGAKLSFIQFPFFGESLFFALAGVLFGYVLFMFLFLQGVTFMAVTGQTTSTTQGVFLVSMMAGLKDYFAHSWWWELIKIMGVFVLVAYVSAYVAVKRHLPKY